MDRIKLIFSLTLFSLGLCGCYDLDSVRPVSSDGARWTGAGDYSQTGQLDGVVVGLAGQNLYRYYSNGTYSRQNNVLSGEFSGPYALTSIAQTFSYGLHEQSFLHGNLQGRTDNLDLFHTEGTYFSWDRAANRIRPYPGLTVRSGAITFEIVEICDMATPDNRSGWTLPYHDDSHLFLSVRACTGGDESGLCAGGMVEVGFDGWPNFWNIQYTGSQPHAQFRRQNGNLFRNECMPIAATRWSDANPSIAREFVYLAAPAFDEVVVAEVDQFHRGILDTLSRPSSHAIQDISVEGMKVGSVHYNFLQGLWAGPSTQNVAHYQVVNGDMPTSHFYVQSVPNNIDFIQGFGGGKRNELMGVGHMMAFGNAANLHKYRED